MAEPLASKTIILGITGSIAAYKAADLASSLTQKGADVRVVMTREACRFITPLTLQTLTGNQVASDLWDAENEYRCGHIDLADEADLLLVAPATAHIIGCFANGLAPELLTSIYLATKAPIILAPAMNGKMYDHPAVDANLATLRERGHTIVEPVGGLLACGYEGKGRLAPVDEIEAAVLGIFK